MKNHQKIPEEPILLLGGILCVLMFGWFYCVPHHYFYVGMDQSEIEAVCGKGLKIVPAASLLSSPPTEYQKEHTTLYWIPIRSMGVNLYLNYYKKVVCIEFLFGKTLGIKEVVNPEPDRVNP